MISRDTEHAHALSRQALIAGLHPDGQPFERIVETSASRIDWHWVIERADAHNVVALLASRLNACALTQRLDERLQAHLANHQAATSSRVTATSETLCEVAARFAQDGIAFLVLKGSILAETIYGDPFLRPFEDVDVVVPPEAVARAEQALRSLGYRLGQVRQLLGARPAEGSETEMAEAVTHRFYVRLHYELPLVPTRRDRTPVDLHWHAAPPSRLQVSPPQLWRETRQVTVAGTPVLTLTPEATLIHLAVHATTCSLQGFKLLPLCDIAWVAARLDLDPARLWELAGSWRARVTLRSALEMVERTFRTPLPERLRTNRPRFVLRPGFGVVARPTFLVHYRSNAAVSQLRRIGAEILWNLSMRCLGYNLKRSAQTRLTRLRWRTLCWQARVAARIAGSRAGP